MSTTETRPCIYCDRELIEDEGIWVDPEASGDDEMWRETCDMHDTFAAEHEPAALRSEGIEIVVNERVLNDDLLLIAPRGRRFAGGHAAILIHHTFRNSWGDDAHELGYSSVSDGLDAAQRRFPDYDPYLYDLTDTALSDELDA